MDTTPFLLATKEAFAIGIRLTASPSNQVTLHYTIPIIDVRSAGDFIEDDQPPISASLYQRAG